MPNVITTGFVDRFSKPCLEAQVVSLAIHCGYRHVLDLGFVTFVHDTLAMFADTMKSLLLNAYPGSLHSIRSQALGWLDFLLLTGAIPYFILSYCVIHEIPMEDIAVFGYVVVLNYYQEVTTIFSSRIYDDVIMFHISAMLEKEGNTKTSSVPSCVFPLVSPQTPVSHQPT